MDYLGVIELKNPADENTDIWKAYNRLQTYKDNIPDLFNTNAVLVIQMEFKQEWVLLQQIGKDLYDGGQSMGED